MNIVDNLVCTSDNFHTNNTIKGSSRIRYNQRIAWNDSSRVIRYDRIY